MWPLFSAATSFVPSAETATQLQCVRREFVTFHVAPESVDRYRWPSALEPPPAASSVRPSAEDATHIQFVTGAVVCAQFNPEFVEMKIEPPEPLPSLVATIFVPSADEAMAVKAWSDGLCWAHVLPPSSEV